MISPRATAILPALSAVLIACVVQQAPPPAPPPGNGDGPPPVASEDPGAAGQEALSPDGSEAGSQDPGLAPEPVPAIEVRPGGPATVRFAGNEFGLDLYRRVAGGTGNVALSPASIHIAFGMTLAGAQTETYKEMASALKLQSIAPADIDFQFAAMRSGFEKIDAADKVELRVANRLFGQGGTHFLKSYLNTVERSYRAPLEVVNFVASPEVERGRINKWVAEKTMNKIEKLLPPGSITSLTRLVLVNAIYFKGAWQHQFDEKLTRDADFVTLAGKTVKAPTMHQKATFRYLEDKDGTQLLEMPYHGGGSTMLFILGRDAAGLKGLENRLSAAQLDSWAQQLRETEVEVALPRFKIRQALALSATLKAMGMVRAFDPDRADFSRMVDNRMDGANQIYISEAFHETFIQVNEEGAEAAAATAVVMAVRAAKPRVPRFIADRPFLFAIRDNATGQVLFFGRIADPTAK